MSIKLLWRTDVHLSDRTPTNRKDKWSDTVIRKLEKIGSLAKEHNVNAVLDGGDFFDIKSPSRNSHSLVRRVIETHREYPCPTYANVGNHDCVYGDYSYLHQQPLGVLFASGCFQRLYDEHEIIFETVSEDILGFETTLKVRVVGVPYHGTEYDLERLTSITKGDEDYLICIAHLLASKKGGSMFEGEDIIKYADLEHLDPDVWCFGHWHCDQGIEKVGNKTIINVGSLTRGSLSQDNLDRIPCAVLITIDENGISTERLDIEIENADDVFHIDRRIKQELKANTMEDFIENVKTQLSQEVQKETVLDTVRAMGGISEDVREKAIHYLENV